MRVGPLALRVPPLPAGWAVLRRIELARPRALAVGWVADRSPRERWLLAGLAATLVAAGVVQLVWRPLAAARVAAQESIDRSDRIAARLRLAGPDVARVAAARAGTLPTLVTARAAKAGLAIARIDPQGPNVGVTLDGVGFDALVGWLAALEHDAGVRVVDLKVDRRPDPGVVTAQVTLTEQ